jgi:HEAT repeat protein
MKTPRSSNETLRRAVAILSALFMLQASQIFGQVVGSKAGIGELNSPDRKVRELAIKNLGIERTENGLNALISHLKTEQVPNLRINTIKALTKYGSPAAIAAIITALNDPSPYVRQWAMVLLEGFSGNEQVAVAISSATMKETDISVKIRAAESLSLHQSTSAVRALERMLKEGGRVRDRALTGLGDMGTDESMAVLEKNRNSSDNPKIRERANKRLKEYREQKAAEKQKK